MGSTRSSSGGATTPTEEKIADLVRVISEAGRIPVVSTVAPDLDVDGQVLNINADTAAAALAVALKAHKLVMLTDVEGVYADWPDRDSLVEQIDAGGATAFGEEPTGVALGGSQPEDGAPEPQVLVGLGHAGGGPLQALAARVLAELGLEEDVLLWNIVPTHPHRPPYVVRGGHRGRDHLYGAGRDCGLHAEGEARQ